MKRRDFLKGIAGLSALAVSPYSSNSYGASQEPQEAKPLPTDRQALVSLAGVSRGGSEEAFKAAVRESASEATDFSWLSKGDSLFIKPALNSGVPYPSTTSPLAIAAMVELLRDKGASRVIVGDMCGIEHVKLSPDGLTGSSRRLMEASGMAKAAQAAGAELHFFEEAGWDAFYEDPMASGAHWKRGLMMPRILKEVDHIILMPRCARHVLAGSTLGLKAAVGYWRTDTRLEYHRDAATFHEKTAESNTVETLLKKQRLILSAADKILTTFGPDDGYVHQPEIGLVIASESVVAHDMVSLAWLLENRRRIPAEKQDGFIDHSPLVASIANDWVVFKLGGLKAAIASDKLIKNDIKTVWDDRVLNHAYTIFGGTPKVAIQAANGMLSDALKKSLTGMIMV
ncbi:MAG: DUF362 domain-containing protein [Deltaproteobacteria bacterium]|nr:DUF362 domain-containing protein [Deltaproteobacteria bacterium]